jgi:hypothetical protein
MSYCGLEPKERNDEPSRLESSFGSRKMRKRQKRANGRTRLIRGMPLIWNGAAMVAVRLVASSALFLLFPSNSAAENQRAGSPSLNEGNSHGPVTACSIVTASA